ncbi:hypothetical protein AA0113_g12245 [Alternaria arborescens]|uniref:Uncharacterized protein n=1 Tax=Alternaria arborescens TaxID=156630 RepID=A0A4Q4PXW4_9PLEO|nr:hypothetical protein AA0111_g11935 [Alternaria arborescens]RYO14562.1 hypothetical protein AA0111_g11935 [Alternaria arborescens]RYO27752.1 hypothetical protein AA0113_g12245 [Alternaria arborescens]
MQNPLPREARTAHRYGRSTQAGAFANAGQEQQLGFRIDPLDVRLITGHDEAYTWSYMPEKAYLFQKHLSKHSMGACIELYDEVGKTFEAIKAARAPDCQTEVDVSFTGTIRQLEQKYALLQQDHIHVVEDCERWKAQATKHEQLRANADNELAVKKADLESAHAVAQDLRRQLQVVSEELGGLQQQHARTVQGVNEISRMWEDVRSGLRTVAGPATV